MQEKVCELFRGVLWLRFMTPRDPSFAERFRAVTRRAGGVPAVARLLGVTTQAVYGWLSGMRPLRDRVSVLCMSLGIDEDWLWSGAGVAPGVQPAAEDSARVAEPAPEDRSLPRRLANMILTFADVPPAFRATSAAQIESAFAEFRRAFLNSVKTP